MQVWTSIDQVPRDFASVVTIGNFDGMHRGHRRVISACVDRARKRGVAAVACTFDPHPRQVHQPDSHMQLISPLEDRLSAMDAAGLDHTLVIH